MPAVVTPSAVPAYRYRTLIAVLIVLGAALASHFIVAGDSLWTDEIATVKFAEQPFANLWSDWMLRETNPPLFYTLLKWWTAFGATSDQAMRLLAFLCALPSLYFGARIAGREGGWVAGFTAALLLACDPAHAFYGQQLRGYGLGHSFGLLAVWGFLVAADGTESKPGRTGPWLYAAGALGAIYTHTTLLLLPLLLNLGFAVAWLARRDARPALTGWIAANVAVAVGAAWWLGITARQLGGAANLDWLTAPDLRLAIDYVMQVYLPEGPFLVRGVIAPIIAAGFGLAIWRLRARPALILPFIAVLVPAILLLVSQARPVFLPRTMFWASGMLWVTVAIGFGVLRPAALRWGALAALLAGMLGANLSTRERGTPEPFHRVVEDINARDPGATVLASGPHVAYLLERYCQPSECRLRVITVQPSAETWSAGMPRPSPVVPTDVLSVVGETFYTVDRGERVQLQDRLQGFASSTPVPVMQPDRSARLLVRQWRRAR